MCCNFYIAMCLSYHCVFNLMCSNYHCVFNLIKMSFWIVRPNSIQKSSVCDEMSHHVYRNFKSNQFLIMNSSTTVSYNNNTRAQKQKNKWKTYKALGIAILWYHGPGIVIGIGIAKKWYRDSPSEVKIKNLKLVEQLILAVCVRRSAYLIFPAFMHAIAVITLLLFITNLIRAAQYNLLFMLI